LGIIRVCIPSKEETGIHLVLLEEPKEKTKVGRIRTKRIALNSAHKDFLISTTLLERHRIVIHSANLHFLQKNYNSIT
jgi:hypothetical protein